MRLLGYMTPTGYQYPGPDSGPQGVARVDFNPARSVLQFGLEFTGIRTPAKCRFYVVAGDKIIGWRDLPPPTDGIIVDTFTVPSQVAQSIEADPSNAIIYIEAPPSTLPREYLPGGVALNAGSIWAQLQADPSDGSGANM